MKLAELKETFAIDDFDSVDAAVMRVVAPGGGETPATITFAGPAHELTRAQQKRLNEARLYTSNIMRSLRQVELGNVLFIVERIIDWAGIKRREGDHLVEVPFTRAAATQLLIDPRKSWLFSQCLEFLSAPGSFMPASGDEADTATESARGERQEAASASEAPAEGAGPRRTSAARK